MQLSLGILLPPLCAKHLSQAILSITWHLLNSYFEKQTTKYNDTVAAIPLHPHTLCMGSTHITSNAKSKGPKTEIQS